MEELSFTKEDFLRSKEPFELVYEQRSDEFSHEQAMYEMADYARTVGVSNFKALYKKFLTSKKRQNSMIYVDNVTEFSGQQIELKAGDWQATDAGIIRRSNFGDEVACPHPVMPVQRLVNIDTGEEKLSIAYRKGRIWRTATVAKTVLASTTKVTDLAGIGIAVTSQNARQFIQYISDLENINYDLIPEVLSIGRLGYIEDHGFSPYVENLTFDGDASFAGLFGSVHEQGDFEVWLDMARSVRNDTVVAKIMLAASFASPLLKPVGSLPFFVHLWSSEGGTGKTVALMVAASVWGNPDVGSYIMTFNSTEVGAERTAAFLNQLPLCMDELQLAKDSRGKTHFNVYKLAEGSGKTRATKYGGVEITPKWRNCILTTGENPLTGESSGSGEMQRVIDIECRAGAPAIRDGHKIAGIVRRNYGWAGKRFVERLYRDEETLKTVSERYQAILKQLYESDKAEKQAMAAAAIVLADELLCEWIFHGTEKPITVDEILQFLASKASVNLGARAYKYICDWAGQNGSMLCQSAETGQVYGARSDGGEVVYIIRSKFEEILKEAAYNPAAVISWLRAEDKLVTSGRHLTVRKRINGLLTDCYGIKMPTDAPEDVDFL